MVRSMQLRCKELTVVVPDMAKSAATILCLGVHHILMGPGGDLGPIDPQMIFPGEDGRRTAVSAKEIVAAIGEAEERIRANPGSFPLFASLLSDVNMLMVEQAKAALSRSEALMREALSVQGRTREEVDALAAKLKEPLIDAPSSHSAVISVDHATGKLQAGVAYRHYDSDVFQFLPAYRDGAVTDKAGILSVGGKYKFTKDVALSAHYARNLEADNYNQSADVQLNYKGSNVVSPGSWGMYLAYRHLGGYSTLMPTYELHRQTYKIPVAGGEYGTKGWVIGASYAPMKNTNIDMAYFHGKSLGSDRSAKTFYTRVQMFW